MISARDEMSSAPSFIGNSIKNRTFKRKYRISIHMKKNAVIPLLVAARAITHMIFCGYFSFTPRGALV